MAPPRQKTLLDILDEDDHRYTPKELDDYLEKFRSENSKTLSDDITNILQNAVESSKNTLNTMKNNREESRVNPEKLLKSIALGEAALAHYVKSKTWRKQAVQAQEKFRNDSRELLDEEMFPTSRNPNSRLDGLVPKANAVGPGNAGGQRRGSHGQRQAWGVGLLKNDSRSSTPKSSSFRPDAIAARATPGTNDQRASVTRLGLPVKNGTAARGTREKTTGAFYTNPSRSSPDQATQRKGAKKDEDPEYKNPGFSRNNATKRTTRSVAKKSQEPIEIMSSDEETENANPPKEPEGQSAKADDLPGATTRRSTRQNAWQSTTAKYTGLKALYPPQGGKTSVQILPSDLARLDPGEFLNDTIIDFFMKWMQDNLNPECLERYHFFNSFFFAKLTERSGDLDIHKDSASKRKINHERVRKWTKGVDIFKKDFLFVPIHDHLHWSLLIICYPSHWGNEDDEQVCCMLHLDSMDSGHNVQSVTAALRGYLTEEWESKVNEEGSVAHEWRKDNPDASLPDFGPKSAPSKRPSHLPRQDNYWDCGLFTLTYIHYFSYMPPEKLNPCTLGTLGDDEHGFPLMLTKQWFTSTNAGLLRKYLREIILSLFIEQAPDKDIPAVVTAVSDLEDLKAEKSRYLFPEAALSDNARRREQLQKERQEQAKKNEEVKDARKAAAQRRQDAKSEAELRTSSLDTDVELLIPDESHLPASQQGVDEFQIIPGPDTKRYMTRSGDPQAHRVSLDDRFNGKFILTRISKGPRWHFEVQPQEGWPPKSRVPNIPRTFQSQAAAEDYMTSEIEAYEGPKPDSSRKILAKRPADSNKGTVGQKKFKQTTMPIRASNRVRETKASSNSFEGLVDYVSDSSHGMSPPTQAKPAQKAEAKDTSKSQEAEEHSEEPMVGVMCHRQAPQNPCSNECGKTSQKESISGSYLKGYDPAGVPKNSFAALGLQAVREHPSSAADIFIPKPQLTAEIPRQTIDYASLTSRADGSPPEALSNAQMLAERAGVTRRDAAANANPGDFIDLSPHKGQQDSHIKASETDEQPGGFSMTVYQSPALRETPTDTKRALPEKDANGGVETNKTFTRRQLGPNVLEDRMLENIDNPPPANGQAVINPGNGHLKETNQAKKKAFAQGMNRFQANVRAGIKRQEEAPVASPAAAPTEDHVDLGDTTDESDASESFGDLRGDMRASAQGIDSLSLDSAPSCTDKPDANPTNGQQGETGRDKQFHRNQRRRARKKQRRSETMAESQHFRDDTNVETKRVYDRRNTSFKSQKLAQQE